MGYCIQKELILDFNQTALQSVRKFYFLEYFYVLLKSIEKCTSSPNLFEVFKELKDEFKLGESKYKKLTIDPETPSKVQLDRFRYTFKQVVEESKEYGLLQSDDLDTLSISDAGKNLIKLYEQNNNQQFYETIFSLIENKNEPFKALLQFIYTANKHKKGLLVFPSYSPRQLGFDKDYILKYSDYYEYLVKLKVQLEIDIQQYVGKKHDLSSQLKSLCLKLSESNLFKTDSVEAFQHSQYNKITKRVRDFWISFFLKDIYQFPLSYSTFEIWTYRAKQLGILNATDFYPNFNGRIVYPTAVIAKASSIPDFNLIYTYPNGEKLLLHSPKGENAEEKFVDYLVRDYFHLRSQSNLYFVRLTALRELVCYNMKISETNFEMFLNSIYKKNLIGTLKIKISLEVDKLPEDTKSMYLKRTPVMVDNKYRNIIAIDLIRKDGRE